MAFDLVSLRPLLVVVRGWVDHCFGSWVLVGLFCLFRVTIVDMARLSVHMHDMYEHCQLHVNI